MANKSVVYLSSAGDQTPHLKQVLEKYLQCKHGAAGQKLVRVLAFRDANPEKHPWEDQPIYKSLKACLHELGHKLESQQYELFLQQKFDVPKFNKLLEGLTLEKQAIIVVVYGGNTWRVASAFSQLPGLRNLMREKVKSGEVMYVSFSAGTILAGQSVALARDPQDKQEGAPIANDGFGLVPYALRPHNQSLKSQEAGQKFEAEVKQGIIKKDDGSPVKKCPVKYIRDGEAGIWFNGKYFLLPSETSSFDAEANRPLDQTPPPQKPMAPDTLISASKCNKCDSVFWPGAGQIYEMHWGEHNGWKPEVATYSQPSVSKSTALTSSKKESGGSVFWPGDGKIYELHWGDHTGWKKELLVRKEKTVSKDVVLTASKCNNCDSVFWPAKGKIYEMHWGEHNGWHPEVITYDQPSVSKSTVLTSSKKDSGGSVFWPGAGTIYELHWGDHTGWKKELVARDQSTVSKGTVLAASKCNNSDSVFWPAKGKIHEMHWGHHNGWCPQVITYDQPSVSKSTVLTSSKKDSGGSVFWPGDGVICELHWGHHNGWRKDYLERVVGLTMQVR